MKYTVNGHYNTTFRARFKRDINISKERRRNNVRIGYLLANVIKSNIALHNFYISIIKIYSCPIESSIAYTWTKKKNNKKEARLIVIAVHWHFEINPRLVHGQVYTKNKVHSGRLLKFFKIKKKLICTI